MSSLGDSKWAAKSANRSSNPVPPLTNNRQPEWHDRHVSVPSFVYTPPGAPINKPLPPSSTTKPPGAATSLPDPLHSTPRPFQLAEDAGKAAAKRMNEILGDANTFAKPSLYQNHSYPSALVNPPARPTITSSMQAASPRAIRLTAETADEERSRLHKLFATWVPRAHEFYEIYASLDLTAEELKAIQDEIVRYRVNSAMAAGKCTPYRAEWETASVQRPPQRGAEGDDEDPLGIGLPRAVTDGRHTGEVPNLLD